jgi:uncharacterized protein (TIGR02996 family)
MLRYQAGWSMLNNAAAFIAALEENEDDEVTRLIYADWLEEQGQYEEAQRQRKWTRAKAWLVQLLNDHQGGDFRPSFLEFRELLTEALASYSRRQSRGEILSCGENFDLMAALNSNSAPFWENWSIVTGLAPPGNPPPERGYFGCC